MVVVPRHKLSKDKIIPDRKSLAAILFGLKAQGKVLVLTNGVYDLLHVGHVRCLEDARSRGDFLVVAVNSDPSKERMEVLAGLGFVDYVTVFDEDTADALIEQLKPNVYAKGTEYTLKTLPERDTLKKHEIKAIFVGDKKTHSSSKLIEKIKKKKFG